MTTARRKSPEAVLARTLLRYAIKRISQVTSELEVSYRNPRTRKIDPVEDAGVATEVRENRAWLAKARRVVRR